MRDFSSDEPPEDWKGLPEEYKRLRKIWLWKRQWGFDDSALQQGRGLKTGPAHGGFGGTATMGRSSEAPPRMMPDAARTRDAESPQKGERKAGRTLPPKPVPEQPYDPAATPFVTSLREILADRWAIDRTAAHDQMTGPYSDARRAELKTLTGDHPIARQYGLRTTANMAKIELQPGLRVHHHDSSIYLRDATSPQAEELLKKVYVTYCRGKGEDPANVNCAVTYKENDKLGQKTAKTFFVNSGADIAARLTRFHGADWGGVLTIKAGEPGGPANRTYTIKDVAEGIHAIDFTPPLSYETRNGAAAKPIDSDAGWFLHGALQPLGATPSTYDAIKAEAVSADTPLTHPLDDPRLLIGKDDPPLRNADALRGLAQSRGAKALSDLPGDHPMKVVATAATQMVTGLERALAETVKTKGDSFARNKLVANALANLGRLLDAAHSYLEDTPRFTKMFDLMVDEVHLLLSTCKPYDADAFDAQASGELYRRAPVLAARSKDIPVKSYLVTSGMDALATGVSAAMTAAGEDQTTLLSPKEDSGPRSANYFQIQGELLHTDKLIRGKGRVVVGTLNPSSPTKTFETGGTGEWDVTNLISAIKGRLDEMEREGKPASQGAPVFVVVDVTVERTSEKAADQELNVLFSAFADLIASGAMTVTLCKSYQKYPSLGSGKIMLGGVTVVGKNQALLDDVAEADKARNATAKDEAQLLTHFVAMGAPDPSAPKGEDTHFDAERQMLKRSADNARALRTMMADPDNPADFEYADGLPFLLYATGPIEFNVKSTGRNKADFSDRKVSEPQHLMQALGVEGRFSFGFQNSSCLKIPGGVRVTVGNEPEGEVVEKFYAIAQIAKTPPAADLAKGKKDAAEAAAQQLDAKAQWPVADVTAAVTAQVRPTIKKYVAQQRLLRGTKVARLTNDAEVAATGVVQAQAAGAVTFPSEARAREVAQLAANAAGIVITRRIYHPEQLSEPASTTINNAVVLAPVWPVAEIKALAIQQVNLFIATLDPETFAPGTLLADLQREGAAASDAAIDRAGGRTGSFADKGRAQDGVNAGLNAAMKALAGRLKTGVSPGDLKAIADKAAATAVTGAVDALGAPPTAAEDGKLRAWANHAKDMLAAAGLWDRAKDKVDDGKSPPSTSMVEELKTLLAVLKSPAELAKALPGQDLLKARFKAVNVAIGPISDPALGDQDASKLRQGMKTGYRFKGFPTAETDAPGFEGSNLPGIMASCATLSATVFDEDETRKEAMEMIDILLDTQMAGVSGEARERLVSRRIQMEMAATQDWAGLEFPEVENKVAMVRKALFAAPYREAAAGLFANTLPEAALRDDVPPIDSAPDPEKRKRLTEARKSLATAFLDRLDLTTELDLLAKLTQMGERGKLRARATRDHLKPRLVAARAAIDQPDLHGEANVPRAPETLANRADGLPPDLDLAGLEILEKAFAELEKLLA